MKLGEIEVNGKSVAVFEPPHAEPDFPWVDVEQLAGAYLPRPEAKRIVRMTHKFGGEIRSYSTARNGDRVATIICHALAQGLCSTIDFKKGWKEPDEPGPVHREYCLALGRFAADNWHMSIEEIVHAYQNPGGVFLRGVL